MGIESLLHGSTGRVISSICILVILLLMFMITVQLYMKRQKKAYFSLALSLVFVIAQYLLIIYLEYSVHVAEMTDYAVLLLRVLAYVWINIGIFQLYNPTNRLVHVLNIAFNAVAFVIASLHVLMPQVADSHNSFVEFMSSPHLLEIYLFGLILLSLFLVRPFVGQPIKYMLCTALYFLDHVIRLWNKYLNTADNRVIDLLDNFLPVVFFITLFLFVFNRIVELLDAIYESSILDGLTGVYNRTYIMGYAQRLVRRKNASVIFCDIDNFKKLNDTEGHQKGDEVLKAVAAIIAETVKDSGKAGRYGGEEMVAVLADTSKKVEKLAETIRQRVEAETPVTVSVGYSKYKDGVTVQDIMKQADEAMYVSKKTGKNKITPYSRQIPKILASLESEPQVRG